MEEDTYVATGTLGFVEVTMSRQVVVNKLEIETPADKFLQAFTLEYAEMDVQFPGKMTPQKLMMTSNPNDQPDRVVSNS